MIDVACMFQGSDGDWQHLLSTQTHKESGERLSYMLRLTHVDNAKICSPEDDDNDGMTEDVLTTFAHDSSLHEIASILFCFHLLYEDLKLDVSYWSNLSMLATLLSMMAADLQLDEYVTHYWQDFPLQVSTYAAASDSDLCRHLNADSCCPITVSQDSGRIQIGPAQTRRPE